MVSPIDLINDPLERRRLNQYVDLAGIDSYDEFKRRVKAGFDTRAGRPLNSNMTESDLRQWYLLEFGRIQRLEKQRPITKTKAGKERKVYMGYKRGRAIGIVKRVSVMVKGKRRIRYRDEKGQFVSIKRPKNKPNNNKFHPDDLKR